MEEYKLSVASSPHASSPVGTKNLMRDVLIALIPALAMGIYVFGPRALTTTLVSVIFCEIFEWGYCKLMHKPNPCKDLSAAITGVLLVFVCPVTLPYWMIIIGDFFAIVVVKQLFGGIGQNFANPAITARVVLLICGFNGAMTTFNLDGVSSATPLADGAANPGFMTMFLGSHAGSLGETCALALLIGGAYLLVRKVISWHIPVAYIGTVAVISLIANLDLSVQLMGGGLLLGAFFMATDYTTSPMTNVGKLIYGVGCGLLTMMVRLWGATPEGVSYAILLMNILTPHIDKLTKHKAFGGEKA